MRSSKVAIAAAALSIAWCGQSWADDATEKALSQKVDELQKQLDDLSKRMADGANRSDDELEQRIAELEKLTKKDQDGLFAYWKNGLRLDSADGAFKLAIFGRIQQDYTFWDSKQEVTDTLGETNVAEEFRRARLGVSGTIYKNVQYKAEYDFAQGTPAFDDVYIQMPDAFCGPGVGVRVGHFDEPMGLDHLTSSKYSTFTERNLCEALVPARNTGIMLFQPLLENKLLWQAGYFRDSNAFGDDVNNDNVGEHNLTARVSGRPWIAENGTDFIHLGLSLSDRNPSQETVQFRSRPEVHTGPQFVDTGAIPNIDTNFQWGFEAAGVMGPFSFLAEMLQSKLTGRTNMSGGVPDQDDFTFTGKSVGASYFLTGESRGYDVKEGRFDRVLVKKNYGADGMGAWELALRYSKLDLNDESIDSELDPSTGKFTAGGELTDWTFAVNWYINSQTRVMFDIIKAERQDLPSIYAFTVRFAIDF